MPDNKKHHYVPRFYLKGFSANGLSINLFNIPSQKHIQNAKLKTQCYRDYFYGKESETEKALSIMEGQVSELIKRIHAERRLPDKFSIDHVTLSFHLNTQAYRTQYAADSLNELTDRFFKEVFKDHPDIPAGGLDGVRIGYDDPVRLSLGMASESFPVIMDLDWRLLVAGAGHEFVTSDNPVVTYNQLMSFIKFGSTTGLSWKGLQIYLPLSPWMALLLFDKDAYVVGDGDSHLVDVSRADDVDQLNTLEAAAALENVYYLSPASRIDAVQRGAARFRRERKASVNSGPKLPTDRGHSQIIASSFSDVRTGLRLTFVRLRKSAQRWRDHQAKQRSQPGMFIRNEDLHRKYDEHRQLVAKGLANREDLIFYLYGSASATGRA